MVDAVISLSVWGPDFRLDVLRSSPKNIHVDIGPVFRGSSSLDHLLQTLNDALLGATLARLDHDRRRDITSR